MGEFGWELFKWQGYIRHIAKDFDYVIVASRPSSLFLYEDFADELIPFEVKSYNCQAYMCFDDKYDSSLEDKIKFDYRVFFEIHGLADNFFKNRIQDFYNYGNSINKVSNKIALHARDFSSSPERGKSARDWGKEKWNDLVSRLSSKGLEIHSVGLTGSSYCIPGTINSMDMDMKELSKLLAECQFIVGASSGLMHFATLCNCSQIVWTEENAGASDGGNVNKYKNTWNPFSTPVNIITDGGWNPSVDLIERELIKWIK